MAAHQYWDALTQAFPTQTDPGDAGDFICDRFMNFFPITTGAGAETRNVPVVDKMCFLVVFMDTDGGGNATVGFDGAFNQSSNVTAEFGDANDTVVMVNLPNRAGWKLLVNDGTTLA
jgi:hypothetical protein